MKSNWDPFIERKKEESTFQVIWKNNNDLLMKKIPIEMDEIFSKLNLPIQDPSLDNSKHSFSQATSKEIIKSKSS